MKRIFTITAILASCFSLSARAESENWYFLFGLGYGIPQYPEDIANELDDVKDAGASNTPITFDLGFYWPVDDGSLILGPSINGISDTYTDVGSASIIKTGLYFSAIKTFSAEPGVGFFARGDLGFPRMAVDVGGLTIGSNYGFGGLIGGGYGLDLGGTRLLFEASYAFSSVEGNYYGTTSFNIAGLF
jgi:hypothetical protein